MLGLFCKGLHCAGCGKGIPFSVVLIVVGIFAVNSPTFDYAVGGAIELAAIAVMASAVFWILAMSFVAVFMRRGPRVCYVQTDRHTYSQMKFLQTGDESWLALTDGKLPRLEAGSVPKAIGGSAEIVPTMVDDRSALAILYRRASERKVLQRCNVVAGCLHGVP